MSDDRIEAGPPVRLGNRTGGPPVRTGWDAPSAPAGAVTRLDDLTDVDAPGAGVLERQPDGIVRSIPRDDLVAAHVADPSPHPAYDDLPSLSLLLENRLV